MQHRLHILKQQINYLECNNNSATQEQKEQERRSTFVSSLFGVATKGDLQIARNEIKKSQGMMKFLLSHESAFTKNIESLMKGEESLSESLRVTVQTDEGSNFSFNTISVMEGLTTSEANVEIKCQFETAHPDTVFQIRGLESVLQDEERKQEMEEMKTPEQHGKKIDIISQCQHLESMEQLININLPLPINTFSFLFNRIEIIALIEVIILKVIRC